MLNAFWHTELDRKTSHCKGLMLDSRAMSSLTSYKTNMFIFMSKPIFSNQLLAERLVSLITADAPPEAWGIVFIRLDAAIRKRGWTKLGDVPDGFLPARIRLEVRNYRTRELSSRLCQRSKEHRE
jgi:hypothetical protein